MYLLGADIGTEGTKVVLIDENGAIVRAQYVSYQYDVGPQGRTEEDPMVWWNAFRECLYNLWNSGINPGEVFGVGITGQMHSPILLDRDDGVIRKSILWNDLRSTDICHQQALNDLWDEHVGEVHNNRLLPGFTAASLLWIQRNEPYLFGKIRRIMLPKDFINFLLTGVFGTESSDASGTGVFDLLNFRWDDARIQKFGFSDSWFAPIATSDSIIGNITAAAEEATGLLRGTPVISGAADNAASMVGTGILRVGQGMLSLGTSGVVVTPVDDLRKLGKWNVPSHWMEGLPLHLYAHALPNTWMAAGCSLSAGASLRWFKDTFANGQTYNDILRNVTDIPPGSGGLIFVPLLAGNRSVLINEPLQAAFVGIGLNHSFHHFARSVLEGVAFSLRDSLELVERRLQFKFHSLVLTGGVIKSSVWPQILCDVLRIPLEADENYQGGAFGVALLVGQALGYLDMNTYFTNPRRTTMFYPTSDHSTYAEVYHQYREQVQNSYQLKCR